MDHSTDARPETEGEERLDRLEARITRLEAQVELLRCGMRLAADTCLRVLDKGDSDGITQQ